MDDPRQDSTARTDPVDTFLSQPALHAAEDEPAVTAESPGADAHRPLQGGGPFARFARSWTRFWFDKEPSAYSSIVPRTPDGRRTKPFLFNGNGRSR